MTSTHTSSPTVRSAGADDAEAFAACHLACWREAYISLWGNEEFDAIDEARMASRRRAEIEGGLADHWLAELDGEVVGIAIAGPTRDDDHPTDLELYAIYVRQASQRRGVGRRLLEQATDDHPVALWTYRDNPQATAFYIKHGFMPDGEERNDSRGIQEIRLLRR